MLKSFVFLNDYMVLKKIYLIGLFNDLFLLVVFHICFFSSSLFYVEKKNLKKLVFARNQKKIVIVKTLAALYFNVFEINQTSGNKTTFDLLHLIDSCIAV